MNAAAWAVGAAMVVNPLMPIADNDRCGEGSEDDIEILIPGEHAAVSVVYRTGDGGQRKAFVRAPMVAVILPGEACRVQCQRPGDALVLRMASTFFQEQARAALGGSAHRLVARYAAFDPFIREVGNALQAELQRERIPNQAYLEPLAGVIAVHLARHYVAAAPSITSPTGLPQHKLKRVQAYIEQHIAEAIHVDRLASEVHMSPFHFARMFKKATGQPPHLYVVMQRVERARTLLRDSEQALIDIAAQAGFRTQGHFTGVFRRYTGLTPRAYRLDCRAAQS
jgi:AraC family transcriptional regulator